MEKNKNEIKIKKTHKQQMDILRYIYSAFVVVSLVAMIILFGVGLIVIPVAMFVTFEVIVIATIYWLFKYTIIKE